MKTTFLALVVPVCAAALASPAAAQVELDQVFASDALPQASFSNKVAISAGWAMVADADRFGGEGVVYVFEQTSSGWIERAILHNPHPDAQDYFGSDIAMEGDTAVISCPRDDVTCPSDPLCESGSAYVYERSGAAWTLVARLVPSDAEDGDFFGYPLGLSGDTLMLGAQYDNETFTDSGSVYVYERSPSGWTESLKLVAGDPGFEHRFGKSIHLSGNQAVIGAPWDQSVGPYQGSAYVFERGPSGWSQTAKLGSPGTFLFGIDDVAIDGDTVLVSGTWTGPAQYGWVHHFERDANGWTERDRIEAGAPYSLDGFGCPIVLRGDRAIIGAEDDDEAGDRAGALYVFDQGASGEWSRVAKVLPAGLEAGDLLGVSLAEFDGTVLVGAYFDDGQAPNAGSAYFIGIGGIRKFCPARPNQSGQAAELSVRGTAGVQDNALTLAAGPVPPTTGLFFYGTRTVQVPFGNLLRCVGGRTYRLGLSTSVQGRFEHTLDLTSPPRPSGLILPGSTWYFQTWFRDPLNGTPHGFSDALAITFGD